MKFKNFKNKKTVIIILSTIAFFILLGAYIVWQVYSKSSCGYSLYYDQEINGCRGVIDQCVGEIRGSMCTGPALGIECGKSKIICGEEVTCSCSEKDNKRWTQVYGKQVH
ncbi:hypothetical protein KKE34_03725 [Patescibacteria group bacterium]|nr:hypothetical protein [Patescibacteria group bacterium]MBU1885688.1 hypothetical protein [Patescibacteria group bacterium]